MLWLVLEASANAFFSPILVQASGTQFFSFEVNVRIGHEADSDAHEPFYDENPYPTWLETNVRIGHNCEHKICPFCTFQVSTHPFIISLTYVDPFRIHY